jgi:hypothetical protein
MNCILQKAPKAVVFPIIPSMHVTTFRILGYADNIVLMRRIIGMVKEAMVNLNNAGKNMGLTVNIQKSHRWK